MVKMKLNNQYDTNSVTFGSDAFLQFYGPFSQELIAEIGQLVKKRLKNEGVNQTIISKVFTLLIEQSQNIYHYSAERIEDTEHESSTLQVGMIAVGMKENRYFVQGGNLIENAFISKLEKKLTHVKSLSKEELKLLYKKQRRSAIYSSNKGAGLGIIEVARKSSRPLEYNFKKIDDQYSFFLIKSEI